MRYRASAFRIPRISGGGRLVFLYDGAVGVSRYPAPYIGLLTGIWRTDKGRRKPKLGADRWLRWDRITPEDRTAGARGDLRAGEIRLSTGGAVLTQGLLPFGRGGLRALALQRRRSRWELPNRSLTERPILSRGLKTRPIYLASVVSAYLQI